MTGDHRRPTVESEAHAWATEYPYDWPPEASDRIIAAQRATRCPDCAGTGQVDTGRRIPADMFGAAETILTRCPTCDGTGYPESETA